jgi:hypothetical protein
MSGIIIAPFNRFLSIEPMLATARWRDRSTATKVPVPPYAKGAAVKGPVERVQCDLRLPPGDAGVLRCCCDLIDLFAAVVADIMRRSYGWYVRC